MAKQFDTGAVVSCADGAFVLNPDAPFKLHVNGLDLETAQKLKRALEKGYTLPRDAEDAALRVLAKSESFECREIDRLVGELAPTFRSSIQQGLAAEPEWPELVAKGDAAANRRRRLMAQIEQTIVDDNGEMFAYLPSLLGGETQARRRAVVQLLSITYAMSGYSAHHQRQRIELRSAVRGWEFMRMPKGCCPSCKRVPERRAAGSCPVVPLHVGCGCGVHPILS